MVAIGHVCGHDSQSAAQRGGEHSAALTPSSEHEIGGLRDEGRGNDPAPTAFYAAERERAAVQKEVFTAFLVHKCSRQ